MNFPVPDSFGSVWALLALIALLWCGEERQAVHGIQEANNARHYRNLRRFGSPLRCIGPARLPRPNQGRAICTRRRPPIELTARGVRIRLSAHRLTASVGLLALGALLSELVTSAGRCGCAHSMDHAEWSDLAIRRGLRRRRLGDWVRPRVSQGDKGRHEQHQSQRRAAD